MSIDKKNTVLYSAISKIVGFGYMMNLGIIVNMLRY